MVGVFLFLRFLTTRTIESQKGTPHSPSITPRGQGGALETEKKGLQLLPFSLLHPHSKNPQGRGLFFWGLRRVSFGGRVVLRNLMPKVLQEMIDIRYYSGRPYKFLSGRKKSMIRGI